MIGNSFEAAKKKIDELYERYMRDYVVQNLRWSDYSEQDTATKFIKPLFEAVGWNMLDMKEMREQVPFEEGKNYVDCILYFEKKSHIVLEFKPMDSGPLHDKFDDISKLLSIAQKFEAKYAVITRFCETIIFDPKTGDEIEYFNPIGYKDKFDILWKLLSKPS